MSAGERSVWGWGAADRFPDRATREALAQQIQAQLGFGPLVPRDPPALDDLALPEPRITAPEHWAPIVSTDRRERALHTYGRNYRDQVRGLGGDYRPAPDLVVFPRAEAEIAQVLRWAVERGVAVVPWGGGTNVVGATECDGAGHAGVVALDLARMDRVLEIDATSQAARIQAGARGPVIEEQLAPHGLTLRHFPQSFEYSTLGGWIATRAGGHFATVYTHIDDLVESVRMVTPRGAWESRRLPGSGAGPSPDRLVLGSEGTLGVITEAWMRVFPRPRHRSKASVRFSRWEDAVEATRAIAQARLYPANCRLLDALEAQVNFVPADGGHVLLLGFESADHRVGAALAAAIALASAHGGAVIDGPHVRDDGEGGLSGAAARWKDAFLEAPYLWSALISLGVLVDTFETAVPWSSFAALHADVKKSVLAALREHCGAGLLTCRFTHVYPDGPAPYYTFLAPAVEGRELQQWDAVKAAASEALMRHGASITHHHAVGRIHRPWYDRQRPPLFGEALGAVKQTLDPAGILNPGCLVTDRG